MVIAKYGNKSNSFTWGFESRQSKIRASMVKMRKKSGHGVPSYLEGAHLTVWVIYTSAHSALKILT